MSQEMVLHAYILYKKWSTKLKFETTLFIYSVCMQRKNICHTTNQKHWAQNTCYELKKKKKV